MTDQLIHGTSTDTRPRSADQQLRRRARAVIPGGMYGHQAAGPLPPEYPQFMREGRGARVWDVAGNEYVDLPWKPPLPGRQPWATARTARAR
jgi:glutamate-1-semialdehyde 2,1-aminomutase